MLEVKVLISPELLVEVEVDAIFEGYFASVAALSITGNHVIADCPVYSERLGHFF